MIGSLRGGDRFEAHVFGAYPLSGPPPVVIETKPYTIEQNTLVYQQQLKKALLEQAPAAYAQIQKALDAKPSKKSAIVDALALAERDFKSQSAARFERRVIILCTDLYEELDDIDFSKTSLSAKRSEAILKQLRAEGRIPDLAQVEVFATGVRIAPKSRKRDGQVEAFWLAFFQECHAVSSPTHFGTYLRQFQGDPQLIQALHAKPTITAVR